ncbi:MAG: hypothetical protein L6Q76_10680 [Polyangiaceae bacterium]|nr:hypothetical protein [Polyangiaceae bacterium]
MIRRSSNQFVERLGAIGGSWSILVAAFVAASPGACLAPDAQQGKPEASTSSSGGTSSGTGTGGDGMGGFGGMGGAGGMGGVGGTGGGVGGAGGAGGGASTKVSAAWLNAYGNGSSQSARAIATDAAGNAIVAGIYVSESMDMGPVTLPDPQQTDSFIAKLTPDGSVLWSRTIASGGDQRVNAVAIDPKDGSIVVVGVFQNSLDTDECEPIQGAGGSDLFVVKLQPDTGASVFCKAFGDSSEQSAYSVAVDASQAIVVTGLFTGTVDFGSPTAPLTVVDDPIIGGDASEIFVVKLDMDGNALAARSLGDAPFIEALTQLGVATDSMNDILITGAFEGVFAIPGVPLYNEGPPDLFLAKLSGATLEPSWWLTSGDAVNGQYGRAIAVDASTDTIYVGGSFVGDLNLGDVSIPAGKSLDSFVAAVNTSGKSIWGKRIGGIGDQYLTGLALDGANAILLGGGFSGVLDFGDGGTLIGSDVMPGGTLDAFVAKLSPDGDHLWSFQASGPDYQLTLGVSPAPNGAYAAGFFTTSITAGDLGAPCEGADDVFVLKLAD